MISKIELIKKLTNNTPSKSPISIRITQKQLKALKEVSNLTGADYSLILEKMLSSALEDSSHFIEFIRNSKGRKQKSESITRTVYMLDEQYHQIQLISELTRVSVGKIYRILMDKVFEIEY